MSKRRSEGMFLFIAPLLCGLLLLGGAACSDDTTSTPLDQSIKQDVGVKSDIGPKPKKDTGTKPKLDKGTPPKKDGGPPPKLDKGTPPKLDKGITPKPDKGLPPKLDKGITPKPDKGITPKPDKGTPPPIKCNPNFNLKSACGGNAVGNWKYKAGCVHPSFFNPGKKLCPTLTVSNSAYALTKGTLSLGAKGKLTRFVTGVVSGTIFVPLTCLGTIPSCIVAQSLIPTLIPGASGTCSAAKAGCTCKVKVPVTTSDTGTWTAKGGVAKVSGPGSILPKTYYFCVQNKVLTYRGAPTNVSDQYITYVLTP